MYKCSNNQSCKATFTDSQASAAKGDCTECGSPLADENGLGWRHHNPQPKAVAKPAAGKVEPNVTKTATADPVKPSR